MAEYQLYGFAQSGNSYRAALMLNLIGATGSRSLSISSRAAFSAHPNFAQLSM
jgi:hypothetical protein